MIRNILFLHLFLFSLSASAYAELLKHPFVQTLQGICRQPPVERADSFLRNLPVGFNPMKLSTPWAQHRQFEVLHKGEKGRPLVVILPGIFSSASDDTPVNVAKLVEELGYQVAIISNPFSLDYFFWSGRLPGDLDLEQLDLYRLIKLLAFQLKSSQKVTLLGMSYGAYLAARLLTYPDEYHRGILISPPLDFKISINKLNNLMERFGPLFFSEPLVDIRDYVLSLCKTGSVPNNRRNTKKSRLIAKNYATAAVIHEGFHRHLIHLARTIHYTLPDLPLQNVPADWYLQFHFGDYLELFAPSYLDKLRAEPSLQDWLQTANAPYHVFTTTNDFINSNQMINDKHYKVYSWGGHLGIVTYPPFLNDLRQLLLVESMIKQ